MKHGGMTHLQAGTSGAIPYVLLHSPLVGPSTWLQTAAALQSKGLPAIAPSLAGILDGGPPYYQRLSEGVSRAVGRLTPRARAALVVHSGAGLLVPSIVRSLPAPKPILVFVDATLPQPGKSWFESASASQVAQVRDMAAEGRLPPWNEWFGSDVMKDLLPDAEVRDRFVAELPRVPVGYFEERAPDADEWRGLPRAYLQLSPSYAGVANIVREDGWVVRTLSANHLAMLTQPTLMCETIEAMVADLVE